MTRFQWLVAPATRSCLMQSGALWMSAGLAASALSRWIVLALLTWNWPVADIGAYILPVTLATPIVQFSRLRLRSLQASDPHATFSFPVIWRLTELTSLAACVVVGALAWSIYSASLALTTLVVAAGLVCESLSELCFGTFLQRERAKWLGWSLILRGILLVAVTACVATVSHEVLALVTAQALVQAAVLCLWDLPVRHRLVSVEERHSRARVTIAALRDLVSVVWPLALATLCVALNQAAPRFFVERWHGLSELGLLAVIGTVLVPGNAFLLGFTQTAVPSLARASLAGNLGEFWRQLVRLYLAGCGTAAATFVAFGAFGEPLLRIVYSAEYAAHPGLLQVLLGACGATYMGYSLVTPFVAQQRFTELLIVNACGLATTIVACWHLVPLYGATGAAWAMLGGAVVVDALLVWRTTGCLRAVQGFSATSSAQATLTTIAGDAR